MSAIQGNAMKMPQIPINTTIRNSYYCTKCDYETRIGFNLRRHMSLIHKVVGEDIYKCKSCNKSYCTLRNLSAHRLTCSTLNTNKHDAQKVPTSLTTIKTVLEDDLICNIENLNAHEQKSPEPKLSLVRIDAYLKSNLEIKSKSATTTDTDPESNLSEDECRVYLCSKCGNTLVGSNEYENHIEKCLVTLENNKPLMDNKTEEHGLVTEPPKNNKAYLGKCNICQKKFVRPSSFNLHMRYAHETKLSFKCTHCQKEFGNKISLLKHMIIHENRPSIKCKFCPTLFRHKRNLNPHVKYMHENPLSFKCNLCKKLFSYPRDLNKHIKYAHDNPLSFKCNLCKKLFSYPGDLSNHVKWAHDNPVSWKCNFCKATFSRLGNLDFHILQCHTTVRRYECNKCDFKTNRKGYYVKHEECCVRKNQSKDSSLISHTKINEYPCPVCGIAWLDISDLIKHVKTHNEKDVSKGKEICIEDDKLFIYADEKENKEEIEMNGEVSVTLENLEEENERDERDNFQDFVDYPTGSFNIVDEDDLKALPSTPNHENTTASKIYYPQKVLKVSLSKCDEIYDTRGSTKGSAAQNEVVNCSKSFNFRVHVCPKCMDFFQDYIEYTHHVKSDLCSQGHMKESNSPRIINGLQIKLPVVLLRKVSTIEKIMPHDVISQSKSQSRPVKKLKNYSSTKKKFTPKFKYTLRKRILIKKRNLDIETMESNTHRPFKCNVCQKRFMYRRNLEGHLKNTHEKNVPIKGHISQKQFCHRNNVELHAKHIHKKKMPFKCHICPKKFAYESYLKFHMKMHNIPDSLEFKCSLCPRQFRHKSNLDYHILDSHTTIRRYRCNNCNLGVNRKDSYVIHMKKCLTNDKLLPNRKNYNSNAKTLKKEEVNYSCPICNTVFQRIHLVVNHMQTHSEADLLGKCGAKSTARFGSHKLRRSNRQAGKRRNFSVQPNEEENQKNNRNGRFQDFNDVWEKSTHNSQDTNGDFNSFDVAERGEITKEMRMALAKALEKLYSNMNSEQDLSIYQCKLCSVTCLDSNALDNHMKRHK